MDYSYAQFQIDMEQIIPILEREDYQYICGVARGGLIPATILSYRLNKPLITFKWSLRDHKHCTIDANTQHILTHSKCLIVEDIIDSGDTLNGIEQFMDVERNEFPDVFALFFNNAQERRIKFYCREINRDINKDWINFWWEK
jgi:hypoxanthine phosphoribosyltransferase